MKQTDQAREFAARNVRILERARLRVGDLADTQVLWVPPDGGWSVGQVLEHLCRTCARYLEKMRIYGSAPAGSRPAGDREYRPSLPGWALLQSLANFQKLPAPPALRPTSRPRPHVLEFFLDHHREIGQLLDSTAGLDWNEIRIASPVTPIFKVNLGDCFSILIVHGERHLVQIERLRDRAEFPQVLSRGEARTARS